MSKVCYECGATHSTKWMEYTVMEEDGYGMACSEPGVPTHIEIPISICKRCDELADSIDDLAFMNY